jgi:hypothetical protein
MLALCNKFYLTTRHHIGRFRAVEAYRQCRKGQKISILSNVILIASRAGDQTRMRLAGSPRAITLFDCADPFQRYVRINIEKRDSFMVLPENTVQLVLPFCPSFLSVFLRWHLRCVKLECHD